MKVNEKVRQIVAEEVGIDVVMDVDRLRQDLHASELDIADIIIILAAEDELNIRVSDFVAMGMVTVGDLIAEVKKQIGASE